MPAFDQAKLETYISKLLDAVLRGDRSTLRRLGQQDGFVNNNIRRLVWFVEEATLLILGPIYFLVQSMVMSYTTSRGLDFRN